MFMNGLKAILVILFFSFCIQSYSQLSLSDLKNTGIKSEEDLKNLGVSEAEISQLKQEYFNSEDNTPETELPQTIKKANTPVQNEIPISTPSEESAHVSQVYGKSIFQSGYINLKENSDRMIPSPNYRLGTGDRISITIWGTSEFSNEYTLDAFGNINPKLVGRINLKGQSFSQAQAIIKSRFSNVYSLNTSKISMNLSFSKVIAVNIVGEVNSPGTYSVPSINSAFNILSLANGITKLGSVRNIQIRRNGQTISTLDVYEFLNNPSKFQHQYLEDGDFIIVKPALGYVKFSGEVNRPGRYEIKEKEELTTLISYVGGFSALADRDAINIIRVDSNKLNFNTVSFDRALKNKIKLQIGDDVNVLGIASLVHGVITINGSINVPGKYKFVPGNKILDLITKAKGTNFNSYLDLVQVIRVEDDLNKKMISINLKEALSDPKSKHNIDLQEFDVVKIFNKNEFLIEHEITVSGMVQSPGLIKFLKDMQLKDIIAGVGGLLNEADHQKIQVERVSFIKGDSANSYIEIIELKYPEDINFKLNPFDHINFRKLPQFQFQQTVQIDGEVEYPGDYTLNGRDERVSDLIKRAGGITNWAFLDGARLYREQDDLGVLLMDLKAVIKNENSKFNYVLKQGDRISVPKTNDIVSISGAIGYKILNTNENFVNTPFHKGKRARFYIKKYGGGYNEKAKKSSVYIVSYNGRVKESIYFGLLKPKVNKGDEIVVNFKQPKPKREKKTPIDWNRVIESSTIKLTGILTILILANNAFVN